MICLGSVPAGTTIYVPFTTYAGSTGASVTCTGLAVTDIEIYKNGSTTQRSSDAGYTLLDTDGIDFDGVTGLHGFSIDLNDNTDAGFYAVGSWYWVVVSAITVDSQTVTFLAAVFRIAPAESVTGKPKVDVDTFGGTAGTFASGRPEVNATHWAGTAVGSTTVRADLINVGGVAVSTTTAQLGVNVVQISADATAADNAESFFDGTGYAGTNNVIPTVTTLTNLPAITANWITAAGITDSAFTAAKFDTACLTTAKFASGAITSTVVADGFITNAKFAAGAIDNAAIAADAIGSSELAATAVAEIADQVWDELLSGHVVAGSAGEALAAATAPSAAAVADAVWDEALAGHLAAGSTGEALNAAGGAGDPWITAVPGAYGAGSAGYILGTNLNATVSSRASQTSVDTVDDFLDTEIAAIKAKTDNLPTDPADQSAVEAAITAATSPLATAANLATVAGYLDTEIAAILTDTNELQTDWADGGRLDLILDARSSQSSVDTIDDLLDTEIAAIKAKTDLIPAAPAAVGDIPTVSQIWTTALTEAYRATGATGTAAQLIHEILQNVTEFTISGTTKTVKKFDGTTTAKTYTLNDATTPTGITEAT